MQNNEQPGMRTENFVISTKIFFYRILITRFDIRFLAEQMQNHYLPKFI